MFQSVVYEVYVTRQSEGVLVWSAHAPWTASVRGGACSLTSERHRDNVSTVCAPEFQEQWDSALPVRACWLWAGYRRIPRPLRLTCPCHGAGQCCNHSHFWLQQSNGIGPCPWSSESQTIKNCDSRTLPCCPPNSNCLIFFYSEMY